MSDWHRCEGSGDQRNVYVTRPGDLYPHHQVADTECPCCARRFTLIVRPEGTVQIPTHRTV